MPRSKKKWLSRREYKETKRKTLGLCLLSISADILWSILSEWITPAELCRLDSSYCNEKLRNPLLELFKSNEFRLDTSVLAKSVKTRAVWEWLLRRCIRCTHYVLVGTNNVGIDGYGGKLFSNIQSLELVDFKNEHFLSILLATCCTVRQLTLRNCACVVSELVVFQELSSWRFASCSDMEEMFLNFRCPKLEHLQMSFFSLLQNGTVRKNNSRNAAVFLNFISSCSQTLVSLDISNGQGFHLVASDVAEACGATLKSLRISYCSLDLTRFALRCVCLTVLELIRCSASVSDAVLVAFSNSCPMLRKCILDYSQDYHDHGVMAMASKCPLEYLSLRRALHITDDAIIAVADLCHGTLNEIYLDDCKQLTDASVLHLLDKCRMIDTITVKGCKLLSDLCYISISMLKS